MAEEIRILLVEPGEKPRLVTIPHTVEHLQEIVGGSIQAVYPWDDAPVALVCNDEGKFKGYPANRLLMDEEGEPYDIIVGTFFICGLGRDNFASLSDELADRFMEQFRWPEMFMRTMDEHVIWFKLKPGEALRMIV